MKCIYCGNDSKYKERTNRKCPACGKGFAFEPQDKDPFTDTAFKASIDAVSAHGHIRWGVEHLYYELCRRLYKRTYPWKYFVPFLVVGGSLLFATGAGLAVLILGPVWLAVWVLLRRYGRPATVRLPQPEFDRLWNRWIAIHGNPPGLIVRKSEPAPARPKEADIGDYSFDRAVICDRARTIDLLIANNFHFENNCAILSIGGYPPGPFETVRTMLKRNPSMQVFALHDASVAGCKLAHHLANDPQWFKGHVAVTDVGIRPRHSRPFEGLFRPAEVSLLTAGKGILGDETEWLNKYVLELAAIRPEQVLKRLFKAINRREESTSSDAFGSSNGYFYDNDSFSSNATDSGGGADSFG
ncbi:MAG: hypothetical protein DMG13_12860 [Acidobacteria bacterium]|nr:MAG: hypothetical protein DMG13_12860 [Acidobacteriota bacterium]